MSVDESQLSSERSKKGASAPAATEKSNVVPASGRFSQEQQRLMNKGFSADDAEIIEAMTQPPAMQYPYPRNIGEWQAKKSAVPLSFRPMALWKLTQPMRDMETQRWFYTEEGQDLLAGVAYRLIMSEELAKRGKRLVTEAERTGSM